MKKEINLKNTNLNKRKNKAKNKDEGKKEWKRKRAKMEKVATKERKEVYKTKKLIRK